MIHQMICCDEDKYINIISFYASIFFYEFIFRRVIACYFFGNSTLLSLKQHAIFSIRVFYLFQQTVCFIFAAN